MYIDELKKELTGRMLDIWRGHDDQGKAIDLPADKQEAYRRIWRRQAKAGSEGLRQTTTAKPCNCGKTSS